MNSRRLLRIGGVVSGAVLFAFGIAVIVLAINGRNTVHNELKQQQISATQLSLFSLVVGIALLLAGVGFIVLALAGALREVAPAKEQPETAPVATT